MIFILMVGVDGPRRIVLTVPSILAIVSYILALWGWLRKRAKLGIWGNSQASSASCDLG